MKSRKIYYFVLLLLLNCFVGSERDKCELEIINEGIGSGSVASCAFAYSIIESGEETIRNANTNQDQRDGSLGSNAGRFLLINCLIKYQRLQGCKNKSEYLPAFQD